MPYYESVFIARQDISSAQAEALADSFAKVIEDQGGTVAKREHWGLRSLAFRIRKNRKGHYVLFNLDAPAAAVQELERQMRINEDILRYLTVRVDALDPGPSAMMQSRSSRGEERGRREGRGRGGDHAEASLASEPTDAVATEAPARGGRPAAEGGEEVRP